MALRSFDPMEIPNGDQRKEPRHLMRTFDSILDLWAVPDLVRLGSNLVGVKFELVKVIPARYMIRRALERGDLSPGGRVVETSSGTFALALAMVCRLEGFPLSLICDPAVNPALRAQLTQLG